MVQRRRSSWQHLLRWCSQGMQAAVHHKRKASRALQQRAGKWAYGMASHVRKIPPLLLAVVLFA